jgi:hypothetical protein
LPTIPRILISTITAAKVGLGVFHCVIHPYATRIVNFILQQFKEAEADYNKSVSLDSTFVFSHIQLAVAQYKLEQVATSMATFRRTMKAFPQRSEPQNY